MDPQPRTQSLKNYDFVVASYLGLGLGGLSLAIDVLSLAFSSSFSSRSSRYELSSTSLSLSDSRDSCSSNSFPSSDRRERFKSACVNKINNNIMLLTNIIKRFSELHDWVFVDSCELDRVTPIWHYDELFFIERK